MRLWFQLFITLAAGGIRADRKLNSLTQLQSWGLKPSVNINRDQQASNACRPYVVFATHSINRLSSLLGRSVEMSLWWICPTVSNECGKGSRNSVPDTVSYNPGFRAWLLTIAEHSICPCENCVSLKNQIWPAVRNVTDLIDQSKSLKTPLSDSSFFFVFEILFLKFKSTKSCAHHSYM